MPVSFKTQTLTVVRPGVIVERGTEYDDWSNTTTHQIAGCRMQPLDTSEVMRTDGTNRDAVVMRWRFFGPFDADLTNRDRAQLGGFLYEVDPEVDGGVQRWSSPTGGLAHSECIFRKVDG